MMRRPPPVGVGVQLAPASRRRLSQLWMRLQDTATSTVETIVRSNVGDFFTTAGLLRDRATPAAVTTELADHETRLDALESGSVSGRWEPVTNGDPLDPQLVFDDTGDVVMSWVED